MRSRLLAAVAILLLAAGPGAATAADLLPGEFAPIDVGRRLVEPKAFPTIRELREAVRRPEIRTVLVFKLFSSGDNLHLPAWSGDGQRLAFQRSDLAGKSSTLLAFWSLAQPQPAPVADQPGAYQYMFRWAVDGPGGYAFVRIDPGSGSSRVYVAHDTEEPACKTPDPARRELPALYRGADGTWRLVYREDGQLVHQAWNDRGPVQRPLALARGTSPRWPRDGYRLLYARERPGAAAPVYDVVVRDLRTEAELLLPCDAGSVRSPTWSPDEKHVAFYVRELGEGKPWRIRVCPVEDQGPAITLGSDVVVNLNFESEGPAWEPSGRRVWFFSHQHRRAAYYPMIAADVASGQLTVVDYPARLTTPNDLAIHPATAVPEIALVAHDGLPQDLFILLLNHY